jgi:hypothetical protein
MRFIDFWQAAGPLLIRKEFTVYNKVARYAGTMDLLCEIGDERWIIDYKTSSGVYDTHYRQLAAYFKCMPTQVDRMAILHLKAGTRTQKDFYQGKGWKLYELEDVEKHFDMFLCSLREFEYEVPEEKRKPDVFIVPEKFSLNIKF